MQMMCTIQNFRIRAVEDDTLHACLLFIYFVFMICGGNVKMAKKLMRGSDGLYHKNGKKFEMNRGSRAQVMHGTAYQTSGELLKKDLM